MVWPVIAGTGHHYYQLHTEFDHLSEEAIMFKCQALAALRQLAAARALYNSFAKEYKDIYGEIFRKEYQELVVD